MRERHHFFYVFFSFRLERQSCCFKQMNTVFGLEISIALSPVNRHGASYKCVGPKLSGNSPYLTLEGMTVFNGIVCHIVLSLVRQVLLDRPLKDASPIARVR